MGTSSGTVVFDPMTGEMIYTPTADEEGTTVTVIYTVCTLDTNVCDSATVTIEVLLDSDDDGIPDIDDIDDDND